VNGALLKRESPSIVRSYLRRKHRMLIEDGGWHFGFLGGPEKIREKIKAFAHVEFNSPTYHSDRNLTKCIAEGKDIFRRDYDYKLDNDLKLPKYLTDNKEKFSHLFYNPSV
jgi:beta-1,4-mannosyl-glycoprotein beta-1,4-N-acetylglucosaminyltransferase